MQFFEQVKLLGQALKNFSEAYERVLEKRTLQLWPLSSDDIAAAKETVPELTGDFCKTLQECEQLLDNESHLQSQRARIVDNVRWNMFGVGDVVTELRERVQFHMTKILLLTKTLELELISGSTQHWSLALDTQGDDNTSAKQWDPRVPNELDERLIDALDINKPASFKEIGQFPLRESFDALMNHYQASTVTFKPTNNLQRIPEVKDYLSLMKSGWILQKIREGSPFKNEGPNSLWAKCLNKAEEDIVAEYRRFELGELQRPNIQVLSTLDDSEFAIWMTSHATEVPPDETDEGPTEEKVLEIASTPSHGTRRTRYLFFRTGERSLRLLRHETDKKDLAVNSRSNNDIDLFSTRLIPFYAIPSPPAAPTLEIHLLRDSTTKRYPLTSQADVKAFQRAITGYEVVADNSNVSWASYQSRLLGTNSARGDGRIQIWRPNPFSRNQSSHTTCRTSPTSSSSTTERNRRRVSSNPDSLGSTVLSTNVSTMRGSGRPNTLGLVVRMTPLPAIVIFTEYNHRLTFLWLCLDQYVNIKENSCGCKDANKSCRHIVFSSKVRLNLRRYSAEGKGMDGLKTWDLLPLAISNHPLARGVKSLDSVRWISLLFESVERE